VGFNPLWLVYQVIAGNNINLKAMIEACPPLGFHTLINGHNYYPKGEFKGDFGTNFPHPKALITVVF